MKRVELFLLILIIGSLWGFFEMIALPVSVLCAIGLFFLVLGRRMIDIPGTSIIIGLIVCFYKTYSDHFFICQWAGVMALAGSFDLYASLVFKSNRENIISNIVTGILTNITAFPVFVILVTYILKEPNWVDGGMERIINYGVQSVLPATLITGLLAAPLGFIAGSKINKLSINLHGKLIPGIYLMLTAFLWIAASIN